MKVLVTGGAGFIGSALSRHLISALDWDVVVVDKLTYAGHRSSLATIENHRNFAFEHADICDRVAMDRIFQVHQPDLVAHLAAESHVDRSIVSSWDFVQTNVVGTFVLLEAARQYWMRLPRRHSERFRFLHVSTDEVYGSLADEGVFTETTAYAPHSPYSASKASSDHLALAWCHTYGLPVVVTHCTNNYGPYQLPEKLIPLTILNGLDNLPLPVYGDGRNRRDWIHVSDHVRALVHILTEGAPGETYDIGVRNERTNIEVVEMVCDLLDRLLPAARSRRSLIALVADRPGHDRRYAIDPSKLEGKLGWHAKRAFVGGLEETVRWYLENGEWWHPLRVAGHGKSRLGLAAIDPSA